MLSKKNVVIGILGNVKDSRFTPDGRQNWRPTVSACRHEQLPVVRLELLIQPEFVAIADELAADIERTCPYADVRRHVIRPHNPWDFEDAYGTLYDFAKTYPFNTEEEDYLIHITTGTHVQRICLFLLTESRHLPGKLLQTRSPDDARRIGANEYTVIDLDLSRYDRIASRFQQQYQDDQSFLKSGIETRNPQFNRLIEQIERVAVNSTKPILLTGPVGAGKSRLARRIYELKQARRQVTGPFVEINCATIRGDAAMSALFGHVKGAFTGAVRDRPGLLAAANGGMLFLDEVGELGVDEQAMLLRALEQKRFLPVGSDMEAESSFQLICGTNRDMDAEVGKGRFREDLYSRINLWTFRLPGLRDRTEDIEPNVDFELSQMASETGIRLTFNKEARQRFLAFAASEHGAWLGNFRDLNGGLARMAAMASGGRINTDLVQEEITRLKHAWSRAKRQGVGMLEQFLAPEDLAKMDPFDRIQLAAVLEVCVGSRSLAEAGRRLFSVSRSKRGRPNDSDRLRKYLARYGLSWQAIQQVGRTRDL